MAKNDSLLAILWMLSREKKLTAKQISEKLEMNIRTVYRYMDALSASGVPLISEAGQNGGYSLLEHFVSTPLFFDLQEQSALAHAAVFAHEAGYPNSEALSRATLKLRRYASEAQENNLDRHLMGFEVIHRQISKEIKDALEMIESAVATERSVHMVYRSARGEDSKARMLDPYGMFYWNNKWYVVGYCHLRREVRSFRVERIVFLEPMEATFVRPEQFSARDFFLSKILTSENSGEKLVTLVVSGRSEALDDLCIHWLLGHLLISRSEQEATFAVSEEVLNIYVPYILLAYGKALKVIEPEKFKARVQNVLLDLLEHYK